MWTIPCDTCILTENYMKFVVMRGSVTFTNIDGLWLFFGMVSVSKLYMSGCPCISVSEISNIMNCHIQYKKCHIRDY
jgi:hypothetical protein